MYSSFALEGNSTARLSLPMLGHLGVPAYLLVQYSCTQGEARKLGSMGSLPVTGEIQWRTRPMPAIHTDNSISHSQHRLTFEEN
jgi:hypothetical protein